MFLPTFFWSAMWSSADIAGPDVFLWFDMTGESLAAAAGDLLGGLSTGASGAADTLVFGVGTLEEGGEGLPPAFSREPLEPKDWNRPNELEVVPVNALSCEVL